MSNPNTTAPLDPVRDHLAAILAAEAYKRRYGDKPGTTTTYRMTAAGWWREAR